MKKIVIAPDSFKGSLTAVQVAESIEKGILRVLPNCNALKFPISDGGEGFVDSIIDAKGGVYKSVLVRDPFMRPIKIEYRIIEQGETAVMEMASASGLTLLASDERNPMDATTYGVGEIIKDAVKSGCKHIILGVGGSATNDGGTGMLQALGFRFFNKNGCELKQGGKILSQISKIDDTDVLEQLKDIKFTVACDVDNPFHGKEGAAWAFAAQKGASPDMILELDEGLKNLANIMMEYKKINIQEHKGTGSAGGLAGACLAFLDAKIVSGIDFVLDVVGFDKCLKDADIVITGEGKMDAQTKRGKATLGVLKRAMIHKIPTIAITGNVENYHELNKSGFLAVFPIIPYPMSEKDAMNSSIASNNIQNIITQIMRIKVY